MRSADGTRIGFYRLGEGPPILFIHGAIATHTDWMRVARLLSHSFMCFLMDRRGRGKSAPGNSPYSIECECEDIAALAAVAGSGLSLVGHSYGAVCALEAGLRIPIQRIVAYEPPLAVSHPFSGEAIELYGAAIEHGDFDSAIEIGLARFSQLSPEAIAKIRASRAWPRMSALAPTWFREIEVINALGLGVERYRALAPPALLLVGSESPQHPMQDAIRALVQTLPNARVETLQGQGHVAMRTAPELVAPLIADFLSE